MHQNWRTNFHK